MIVLLREVRGHGWQGVLQAFGSGLAPHVTRKATKEKKRIVTVLDGQNRQVFVSPHGMHPDYRCIGTSRLWLYTCRFGHVPLASEHAILTQTNVIQDRRPRKAGSATTSREWTG